MKTRIQKISSFLLILVLVCAGVELPAPKVAQATTCGAGSDIGGGQCRVFLTSGTSWTLPSDWSSTNTVEGIGGGGGGANGSVGASATGGGGGGEYRKIANFVGVGTISYSVGAGGAAGVAGGDTTWDSTTLVAKGGSPGSSSASGAGGTGGTGAAANYNGGAGGTATVHSVAPGGGGAGGPLGVGGAGAANLAGGGGAGGGGNGGGSAGSATGTGVGGNGGDNQAGSGHGVGGADGAPPAAGTAGTSGGGGGGGGRLVSGGGPGGAGGAGSSGTEWDSTHGSGGGGGSAGSSNTGPATTGAGGLYGGGGGGGSTTVNAPVTPGGAGAQGIIVITYTSSASASTNYVRANATAGSLSTTLDIGTAGTNRLVAVYAMTEADSATGPSAVTVDGKSCIQVQTAYNTNGAGSRTDLWYCDEDNLGASNGSVTITVTRASGTAANWAVHAQLFTGIAQSGPRDSGVDTTSVSTNTSIVAGIDVVAGGIVTMGTANGQQALTNVGHTSPLAEVSDADPSSADAVTAQGTESNTQTNKTYTHTWSGTHNRASAVVASWDVIPPPSRTIRLFGSIAGAVNTTYLTSGTSYTVPSDWNSNQNTIEVIGGGGGGNASTAAATGGGGGAYSKVSNISLTPAASITYAVGAGGGTAAAGDDTYFNGASCAGASVCAKGGGAGGTSAAAGGAAASGVGAVRYSGGASGANDPSGWGTSGGGGAAGPYGGGAAGGAGNHAGGGGGGNGGGSVGSAGVGLNSTGGAGGNNRDGTGSGAGGAGADGGGSPGTAGTNGGGGGGGGSAGNGVGGNGAVGGAGQEWDATHGSGGGGGGGGRTSGGGSAGAAGGNYGGGGGASGYLGSASGGAGAQGIIVIKYAAPVRTLRIIGSVASSVPVNRTAKTVTANGNAQIDTAQSKFGGASALFDGSSYLTTPDSADWYFAAGDFTIDLWVTVSSAVSYGTLIGQFAASNSLWKFDLGPSGTHPRFESEGAGGTVADYAVTDAQTFTINTPYHLAVVRSGTNIYIFKDGVSLALTAGTAVSTNEIPNVADQLSIGHDALNAGRGINGWMDEIRVSKGIARWTSNFTPPTSAYNTNDSYTKLLLHADGTDAATTFTDDVSETFAPNRQLIIYPQR